MQNFWFTSDTHYGHDNIRRYCDRPFSSVEEMDEIIIQNHNALVKPNDIVFHLGDFSFTDPVPYLERLNGRKHIIKGNHDYRRLNQLKHFVWAKDTAMVKVGDSHVWLSHYAHRTWNRRHYGVGHLYGHNHGTLRGTCGKSFDIGVDVWGYAPVAWEQVVHIFNSRDEWEALNDDISEKERFKTMIRNV